MGGGGRPRSANAERGTVVVDGTTYEYTLYTGKKRSRWQIKFCEPGQKQITADFKNGDEDDEPKEPEELERDLGKILEEEKDREMPPDAPVPSIARKTLKQLGAPIQQFDELRAAVAVEQQTFEDGAAAERARRDAARETDKFQRQQPLVAPAVDSLVGKRIEYLTWVGFPNGGEAKHWFAGLVEQVSDGTVRKGPRAKACHQAGFARILWDAQPALGEHEPTESWVALRPNKFNGDARCCWRLDLD